MLERRDDIPYTFSFSSNITTRSLCKCTFAIWIHVDQTESGDLTARERETAQDVLLLFLFSMSGLFEKPSAF